MQERSKTPETIEIGSMEQPQILTSQPPSAIVPDDRVSQLTKELTQRGEVGAPSCPFVLKLNLVAISLLLLIKVSSTTFPKPLRVKSASTLCTSLLR